MSDKKASDSFVRSNTFDLIRGILRSNAFLEVKDLHATCYGMKAIVKDNNAGPDEEKFYEIIVNVTDYSEV